MRHLRWVSVVLVVEARWTLDISQIVADDDDVDHVVGCPVRSCDVYIFCVVSKGDNGGDSSTDAPGGTGRTEHGVDARREIAV